MTAVDSIVVDHDSPTPPFEQVRTAIAEAVRSGALPPDSRLPTVRALADRLGLAVNTVARAYRELENDGFVETRGRLGTFASPHGDPAERQAQLAAAAYARRTRELGVPDDVARRIVDAALRRP